MQNYDANLLKICLKKKYVLAMSSVALGRRPRLLGGFPRPSTSGAAGPPPSWPPRTTDRWVRIFDSITILHLLVFVFERAKISTHHQNNQNPLAAQNSKIAVVSAPILMAKAAFSAFFKLLDSQNNQQNLCSHLNHFPIPPVFW